MNKIGLIIKREYLSRVRNKAFIILSLLIPVLIAVLIMVPVWIQQSAQKRTVIKVVDHSMVFGRVLKREKETQHIVYDTTDISSNLEEIAARYDDNEDTVVLYIKKNFMEAPLVELYNNSHPGLFVINKVKLDLHDIYRKTQIYIRFGTDLQKLDAMLPKVIVDYQGEGMNPKMKFYVALSVAFLMYLMIIIYGVQVMRAVIEEKTSRIIEIIVSSVKPVKLLWGKIIGISLIGVTQMIIIGIVTIVIFTVIQSTVDIDAQQIIDSRMELLDPSGKPLEQTPMTISKQDLDTIEYINELKTFAPTLLIVTPFLFIGGFLLYSSLFASAGAAVDSDTDTQQFVLPITLPIIASIFIAISVIQNPGSDLAFWASLFPLSSPIVMSARLPFMDISTDWWQILIAILLLAGTVWLSMRIAAKIYRTGILMYGQKPSYRNIVKWLRNSN